MADARPEGRLISCTGLATSGPSGRLRYCEGALTHERAKDLIPTTTVDNSPSAIRHLNDRWKTPSLIAAKWSAAPQRNRRTGSRPQCAVCSRSLFWRAMWPSLAWPINCFMKTV
jgi:hypothetical protein